MKIIFLFMLLFPILSNAKTILITNANYKEALSNSQFLKFSMVSWKLGLFKSTFKNFVKEFEISFHENASFIEKGTIKFKVKSMDTDIDSRNEKMWNFCLEETKHPEISIQFIDKIDFSNTNEQKINSRMNVRGEDHDIAVFVTPGYKDGKRILIGRADLSMKALKIPDPSIAVGSVEDAIKIEFSVSE